MWRRISLINTVGADAIEEWRSDATGQHWKKMGVLTPNTGRRYQNIQFVTEAKGGVMPGRKMSMRKTISWGMYKGYLAFFFDHSGEESGR